MINEIFTIGGGEILYFILNGVAMLCNEKIIFTIATSMGLLYATTKSMINSDAVSVAKYMAWVTLATTLLFVPKMPVVITDTVTKEQFKVDNIPFALGKAASLVNNFCFSITKEFEKVFNIGMLNYTNSGLMFGASLVKDLNRIKIDDKETRKLFKNFVSDCVFYDLAASNKYTYTDLQETKNIWNVIKNGTSPSRRFLFQKGARKEYMSCKVGAGVMEELWNEIIDKSALSLSAKYFGNKNTSLAKGQLLSHIDRTYSFLGKESVRATEVIQQSIMMNVLEEGLASGIAKVAAKPIAHRVAADRAYMHHVNSGFLAGDMAAKSLPILKLLFTAILYALFPLIIIQTLISVSGFKALAKFFEFLLWVESWPIIYCVLNFIMEYKVSMEATSLTSLLGMSSTSMGVTNSLYNVYGELGAAAGLLSLSIPFISYGILKGGVSSFVHLASHLGSNIQGAVSKGASELTDGNYSIGNTSIANKSAYNTGSFKNDVDVSSRHGKSSFRDGEGNNMSGFSSSDSMSLDTTEKSSRLADRVEMSDNLTSSFSEAQSQLTERANSESISATEQEIKGMEQTLNMLDTLSSDKTKLNEATKSMTTDERQNLHEAMLWKAELNKQNEHNENINNQSLAKGFISASGSTGFKFLGNGGTLTGGTEGNLIYTSEVGNSDKTSSSENASNSINLDKSLSSVQSWASSERNSITDREGHSYSEGIGSSIRKSNELRTSSDNHLREAENLNKSISFAQSKSINTNYDLSQNYVDDLQNKLDTGKYTKDDYAKATSNNLWERKPYMEEFKQGVTKEVIDYAKENAITNTQDMQKAFNAQKSIKSSQFAGQTYPGVQMRNNSIKKFKLEDDLSNEVTNKLNSNEQRINTKEETIIDKQNNLSNEHAKNIDKNKFGNSVGNLAMDGGKGVVGIAKDVLIDKDIKTLLSDDNLRERKFNKEDNND